MGDEKPHIQGTGYPAKNTPGPLTACQAHTRERAQQDQQSCPPGLQPTVDGEICGVQKSYWLIHGPRNSEKHILS